MSETHSNHISATLPKQKLPFSQKGKKWREQCVEAICSMGNQRELNGRTTWARKQINYDLVNSIIDENDFTHVLDPYGMGKEKIGSQPAKLRNINLVVNKINLLKGEEMTRPFNFQVVATNGEALTFRENETKKMLLAEAQKLSAKESGIPQLEQINPETGEKEEPKPFEEVEKYALHNIKDIREQWGNDILQYLEYKENLKLVFNEGWEHSLIAAEEIYHVGIVNKQPKVRACNPVNLEFDRNPDNPWIQDGDWVKEDRWMTAGQILDECGEYLSDEQIKKLDEGNLMQGLSNQMFPGFGYTEEDIYHYEKGGFSTKNTSNSTHYLVSHVVWKSMKKIGFVSYPDENGEMQEGLVDESFKLAPEMIEAGYQLEWRWIPEVWEGTKIGADEFVHIQPLPNQSRSMDNPSEVKLPYYGRVYNATNSVQTSLVDLIKPHQYLYNIVWYRLEAELAKAKGKKMVMDIAQIPRSEGIDLDKWMYFFDNVGIAFINSFEEGKDRFQGQVSQFNQFQNLDMGLSQAVGQYVQILAKIEQEVDRIVGITPQREGMTNASETATSTRASITNSSYITEPWFYIHNEVKKKVLSALLETAKFAYPGQKKLHYILDDVQRVFTEIDMEKFSDSDYGVFISNSSRDNMIFTKLEQLAGMALQADKATFSDLIAMYKSNSISELSVKIRQSEQDKMQRDQEMQQMQQQMQQEQIQAQAEEKDRDRQFEAEQNQLDRQARLQEAALKVTGFDTDTADNDRLDAIEASKNMLEHSKLAYDQANERMKLSHDSNERNKDRKLKEKEIESKEKIEKLKAKTALKNKVPGEK
jgi:hypothetical protein